MEIAVASTGTVMASELDPRFGRARYFLIVDTDTDELLVVDNKEGVEASGGAGVRSAGIVADHGVEWVITGNVGPKALQGLESAGIRVAVSEPMEVSRVLQSFKKGDLKELKDS